MTAIYLDHAAATPLDPTVQAAMVPYFSKHFYNPSALYGAAERVRHDVDTARSSVARSLGVRPAEIVFTAGGSEANNLAIHGVMTRYPGARLLMSAIEHDSVLEAGKQFAHDMVSVTGQGIVDTAALKEQIDDNTVMISIMYANNEIGTIQPIREIGQLIAAIRKDRRSRGVVLPLYFHSDAAQAANYLDLQAPRLGVDLLTLNGGKIYGPKQSGLLYVRGGVELQPLIRGGGQERNIRSGTENVPAIIGFAAALEIAQQSRHTESKRLAELQHYFYVHLAELLPGAVINGSRKKRLPNNIHITIAGQDNERLLFQLDAAGIMAAAGSACSASSDTPSHVLQAIGLSDAAARASLRFTMGRATTQAELEHVIQTLRDLTQ